MRPTVRLVMQDQREDVLVGAGAHTHGDMRVSVRYTSRTGGSVNSAIVKTAPMLRSPWPGISRALMADWHSLTVLRMRRA